MTDLTEVAKEYRDYLRRWKAQGKPVLPMARACGCGPIEVTVPDAPGKVWSSLMTCPACGALSMTLRTSEWAQSNTPEGVT